MWQFQNPVKVLFGNGALEEIGTILQGRCYAIVTYNNSYFDELAEVIQKSAEGCAVVLNQVHENPDLMDLPEICEAFKPYMGQVEVFVALGGGSVIDTTKALAVALDDPKRIEAVLKNGAIVEKALPIIAIPTTTGTGSEVTSWATIWDKANNSKFSLNDPKLYAVAALCDPLLTLKLPVSLTVQTGLDALSHAMESIWNKNANPLSLQYATVAIRSILEVLPALTRDPENIELREKMMLASMNAGFAFSNTKTSIAHNISYAVTLNKWVAHGIACSFTLPTILGSFANSDCSIANNLRSIFGEDLTQASKELSAWIESLGIKTAPKDYGYESDHWTQLIIDALGGERGKNFSGNTDQLIQSFKF